MHEGFFDLNPPVVRFVVYKEVKVSAPDSKMPGLAMTSSYIEVPEVLLKQWAKNNGWIENNNGDNENEK